MERPPRHSSSPPWIALALTLLTSATARAGESFAPPDLQADRDRSERSAKSPSCAALEAHRQEIRARFAAPATIEDRRRAAIVETARLSLQNIQAARARDQALIAAALADAGVTGLTAAQAVSALRAQATHLAAVRKLLPVDGKPYSTEAGYPVPTSDAAAYPHWFDYMVAGNMAKNAGAIAVELRAIASPTDVLARLLARAGEPPSGPGITPYEAKVVLFYSLPMDARRALAERMQLRFDVRDILPAGHASAAVCAASAYDCTIITDGYVYGALRNSAISFRFGELRDGALSLSTDCSGFVQQAFEGAGYPASSFVSPAATSKMVTGRMPGFKSGLFSVEPIKSERDLLPGDAIAWNGHTQLFSGYEEIEGELRPIVIEAVGGRWRAAKASFAPFVIRGPRCGKPTRAFSRFRGLDLPTE